MWILQVQTEPTWSSGYLRLQRSHLVPYSNRYILLVTNSSDSRWARLMTNVLAQFCVPKLVRYDELSEYLMDLDVTAIVFEDDLFQDVVQCIACIRNDLPNIPVLVAANSVSWKRARTLLGAGADDYFSATLNRSDLLLTLQKHLGNLVSQVDS